MTADTAAAAGEALVSNEYMGDEINKIARSSALAASGSFAAGAGATV